MGWLNNSLTTKLQRHPGIMRALFGLPQRLFPVVNFGGMVAAFKDGDIRDVLARSAHFEFGAANRDKMLLGDFLLGLDAEPSNLAEKDLLSTVLVALRANRLPAALDTVWTALDAGLEKQVASGGIMTNGSGQHQLDLVTDFAEPFVTKLTIEFFGIPVPTTPSRVVAADGEPLLAQWIRKVGSVIATSSPAPFGLQTVAEKCADEYSAHLDDVIRHSLQKPLAENLDQAQTVLEGMIVEFRRRCGSDPSVEYVRRNLGGLTLAGNAPIIKSLVNAIDQLLYRTDPLPVTHASVLPVPSDRPPLAHAIAAATAPGAPGLRQYLFEALRFNPTFPVLARTCPRAEVIGTQATRTVVAPTNATVIAPPIAAMFDPERVHRPETFAHNRSDTDYLHFGYGGHRCLGEAIATDVLLRMAKELLRFRHFESVVKGRFRFDGPAIASYRIWTDK